LKDAEADLTMAHWLKSKKFHLIFWGILAVYLFSASPVYTHFILQNGKPHQPDLPLPSESGNIIYQLGNLTPIRVSGQDLYELRGFAFVQSRMEQRNKISIVLRSVGAPGQTLVFDTHPITVPGMIKTYKGYKPGMDPAEFSFFLSQAVLKPGVYHIGLLLEDQTGTGRALVMTGSSIKITPNTTAYVP
jgi:hypothetical protein